MKPEPLETKLAAQSWREVPLAWRREILAAARAAQAAPAPGLWDQMAELLWPSPKAWAGLAAAWVVLILINLGLAGSDAARRSEAAAAPQFAKHWQQQQRLLNELFDPENAATVSPPTQGPTPRSERLPVFRHG